MEDVESDWKILEYSLKTTPSVIPRLALPPKWDPLGTMCMQEAAQTDQIPTGGKNKERLFLMEKLALFSLKVSPCGIDGEQPML